jgi:hypothetical protein
VHVEVRYFQELNNRPPHMSPCRAILRLQNQRQKMTRLLMAGLRDILDPGVGAHHTTWRIAVSIE